MITMEIKAGDLVCYRHSKTGERFVGMVTSVSNPYKNIVEWFNGTQSVEDGDYLILMRQQYLALRKIL